MYHVKTDQFLYTLCVALAFTCEGGHFSTFPAAAVKIFGMEKGAQIFTIMFVAVPLSSLTGFAITQAGDSVDPQTIFYIASFLTLLTMVLLMFFDDQEIEIDSNDQLMGYKMENTFYGQLIGKKAKTQYAELRNEKTQYLKGNHLAIANSRETSNAETSF